MLRIFLFAVISPLLGILIASEVYPQPVSNSISSDEAIIDILVEGESWLFRSREYCDTHKIVFYDDGSYGAYKYDEGFRDFNGVWYEPSWYLDSSPMGSYFSVQNGVLRLHSGRSSEPSYFDIAAASHYQINLIEDSEGLRTSLVNCIASDQEFAAGVEELSSQETVSASRFIVPSLENIPIKRDLSDSVGHSRLEGYNRRKDGLIDDIVFFDDSYDCGSALRITFGCSESIQSLMDELILRRRRLGSEDTIRIVSNYENNCFNEEGRESSFYLRYAAYRFHVYIEDNEPEVGVNFPYSYQRSTNESYYVSCSTPHDQARDVILSGQLFSSLNTEIYPCDDEDLQATYDASESSYHSYTTENEICSLSRAGCTSDFVFSTMISQVRLIAPTTDVATPVADCQVNTLNLPGPWGVDSIRTTVNPDGLSITNYTKLDHVLHPGKVTRTVIQRNSSVYVVTVGEGSGRGPQINEFFASGTWFTEGFNDVDRLLRQEVSDRLPQPGNPSNQQF